ncbi:hypothetical protein HPB47_016374 [Ixodes persulcatus]|uniref:Uncharacterized protein n=1 Tax=Ixodes persulcatus TaxID=34615 RepID=A0AC60QT32_IXOPE|nr:hypothetical protein HPB47_016374 [Ixodes persulcatus]
MAVVLSEYGASLRAFARSRYVEKVRLSGGTDPLLFDDDDTVMEHDLYSKVQDIDIKDYLVGKTSFITREQFKAHKALEAHNYVTSRWVQPPRLKVLPNGDVVVIGKADILKECENVASGISIEPEATGGPRPVVFEAAGQDTYAENVANSGGSLRHRETATAGGGKKSLLSAGRAENTIHQIEPPQPPPGLPEAHTGSGD